MADLREVLTDKEANALEGTAGSFVFCAISYGVDEMGMTGQNADPAIPSELLEDATDAAQLE